SLGSYPAITAFYTLSLHDALPIFLKLSICTGARQNGASHALVFDGAVFIGVPDPELFSVREVMEDTTGAKEMVRGIRHVLVNQRSEEHTSELQSPYDLVCRLLLEK